MEQAEYQNFCQILKEELIPAEGCTEPIAVAYAAAVARKWLGMQPEHIRIGVSGNIVKNVMGVYIPHCGTMRGVPAAAAIGALAGDAERALEALSGVEQEQIEQAKQFLKENRCKMYVLDGVEGLRIIVEAFSGEHSAFCEINHTHTNVVRIIKDGTTVFQADAKTEQTGVQTDRSSLTVERIVEFANEVRLEDVSEIIDRQIQCNLKIAEAGLNGEWGNGIGKLLRSRGDLYRAYASAASDARMSGCNLPVVIVSGSGNQGATASLPVVQYAKQHGISDEKMKRALVLSNLIAIHLKSGIGRLSAYCGAVSAATGSGAAMTYLAGGTVVQIQATVTNSIATSSGIVCDGAKPSCAAKIAVSLEGAKIAHEMAMVGEQFEPGTGIVKGDVESTIDAVGQIASEGMCVTDKEILKIMTA